MAQTLNNLFWTSGWDSTFRLLQIVFIEKQTVQPIYIIDEERKSLKNELKALEAILKKIELKSLEARNLILPIKYYKKSDIIITPEIKAAFQQIRTYIKIGSQYDWISSLCETENLKNVELCIFKNERTDILFNSIKQEQKENVTASEETKTNAAIQLVFKHYLFPVLDIQKMDMYTVSKKNNWLDIMNLTWFCHTPKNGKPCGKCNPCKITIKEGLGFRVPFLNRIKGRFKRFLKK